MEISSVVCLHKKLDPFSFLIQRDADTASSHLTSYATDCLCTEGFYTQTTPFWPTPPHSNPDIIAPGAPLPRMSDLGWVLQ